MRCCDANVSLREGRFEILPHNHVKSDELKKMEIVLSKVKTQQQCAKFMQSSWQRHLMYERYPTYMNERIFVVLFLLYLVCIFRNLCNKISGLFWCLCCKMQTYFCLLLEIIEKQFFIKNEFISIVKRRFPGKSDNLLKGKDSLKQNLFTKSSSSSV